MENKSDALRPVAAALAGGAVPCLRKVLGPVGGSGRLYYRKVDARERAAGSSTRKQDEAIRTMRDFFARLSLSPVGVGLAVVTVSLCIAGCGGRSDLEGGDSSIGSAGEVDEARLRVQGFWEAYRGANSARLAGRFDEAEEGYRAALAFDPEHEDALYYLGNVLLERGAYEPAAETWSALVTVNPAGARAYGQLGRLALCRTEAGIHDLDASVRYFRTAHQLNREETGSQLRLAEAFLLRGQVDSAIVYLDAVLGSHTESPDALYLRSWIEWSQGNPDRAKRRFREGVALVEAAAPAPVAGEGDTRHGATPIGQSEVGCPALAGLVPPMPLDESDLVAAFQATSKVLASRR